MIRPQDTSLGLEAGLKKGLGFLELITGHEQGGEAADRVQSGRMLWPQDDTT